MSSARKGLVAVPEICITPHNAWEILSLIYLHAISFCRNYLISLIHYWSMPLANGSRRSYTRKLIYSTSIFHRLLSFNWKSFSDESQEPVYDKDLGEKKKHRLSFRERGWNARASRLRRRRHSCARPQSEATFVVLGRKCVSIAYSLLSSRSFFFHCVVMLVLGCFSTG